MENIQVGLRFLPLSKLLDSADPPQLGWTIENGYLLQIPDPQSHPASASPCKSPYNFENLFGMESSTQDIYDSMVRTVLHGSMEGINGTVMAYGMTGSGKTHTLLGTAAAFHSGKSIGSSNPMEEETQTKRSSQVEGIQEERNQQPTEDKEEDQKGLLSIALDELYALIKAQSDRKTFLVKCSYLEIYSDRVYDLLGPIEKMSDALTISEGFRKEFQIKGACEEIVSSSEEAHLLIQQGEKHRHYASTVLNHASSRSHTIFKIHIHSFSKEKNLTKESVLVRILNFLRLWVVYA